MRVAETVGVEEEFHLVDTGGLLVPAAQEVLAAAGDRVEPELMRSAVETASPVCRTVDEVRHAVAAARREAIGAAAHAGVRVVTAGTVPAELPAEAWPYPKRRYEEMVDDYGEVGRQQVVCAAQWHVGVDDRDEAVKLATAIRRWLPVLLALSASSPYFDGRDTGYASYRTVVWSRWPTAGVYGSFSGADDYDATVEALIASGAARDPGMIYFHARPSANYPTLEVRVADACPRLEDVVTLAGLVQGLVLALHRLPEPDARVELLHAANWVAARRGLGSTLLHPLTFRPVPAADAVSLLLDRARPGLDDLGVTAQVEAGVASILADGGSAARQRAVVDGGGTLAGVTDLLAAETADLPG